MTMLREDGYVPLGRYGFISDCRGGALVAADGSVDWLAGPEMDDAPLCAALLDPHDGGCITLAPTVEHTCEQRYLPDTLVLETTFHCADAVVRVTDSLNRATAGPLPWAELARRVDVVGEPVPMRWQVRPGHLLGRVRPWVQSRPGGPLLRAGRLHAAVVTQDLGDPRPDAAAVSGEAVVSGDRPALLAVVVNGAEPLIVPDAAAVLHRQQRTLEFWRQWCTEIDFDGPHVEAVRLSAMVLKAMTLAGTDGMLAALTTSLPERIGGHRNFDYRFGWTRDASFALDALAQLNLSEEMHGALTWLLDATRRTAPEVHTMYLPRGEPAPVRMDSVEAMPGYRSSSPVHVGNTAAGQRQLGAYGDLLDAVGRYCDRHGMLDPDTAVGLERIIDHVCDSWPERDAGIWELGSQEHYTISKIGCWVALDRGIRLAEAAQLATSHVQRWRSEREAVRSWVDEHCWSESKQSYTFHAGTEELDASVLLAARTGFLAPSDPRLRSTIEAVRTELGAGGPLLYRYSGMAQEEGAFVACTFWLVEALAISGDVAEAARLLDEALAHSGDTGLFSEEIDPGSGELLGNLPQVLSHLAVIGAAVAVHRSR